MCVCITWKNIFPNHSPVYLYTFLLHYFLACSLVLFNSVGPPRVQQQQQHPGRISDYTPEEPQHPAGGTPYSSRNSAGARQVYDSSVGKGEVLFV